MQKCRGSGKNYSISIQMSLNENPQIYNQEFRLMLLFKKNYHQGFFMMPSTYNVHEVWIKKAVFLDMHFKLSEGNV